MEPARICQVSSSFYILHYQFTPMNVTDVCSDYYRLLGNTTIGFSSCNDCYSCKSTSGTICHHYTQYLNIIKCIQTQFFHLFQHKGITTIRDQSCNDLKSCSETSGKFTHCLKTYFELTSIIFQLTMITYIVHCALYILLQGTLQLRIRAVTHSIHARRLQVNKIIFNIVVESV